MKFGYAAALAGVQLALLPAIVAKATTAYVTDELVLGVYAEPNTQGQRLATLHSGASVDTLAVSGESTQVRLPDGKIGWVKTTYLTTREPATLRLKQLQDELDRNGSTTPGLVEAAEHSEVVRLTRELAARQAPLQPRDDAPPGAVLLEDRASAVPAPAPRSNDGAFGTAVGAPFQSRIWLWLVTVCAALGCGFWLGYASLARRIRDKFGGLKVY